MFPFRKFQRAETHDEDLMAAFNSLIEPATLAVDVEIDSEPHPGTSRRRAPGQYFRGPADSGRTGLQFANQCENCRRQAARGP